MEAKQIIIDYFVRQGKEAYDVSDHGDGNYSCRVCGCIAYIVVQSGRIVGDIWYE